MPAREPKDQLDAERFASVMQGFRAVIASNIAVIATSLLASETCSEEEEALDEAIRRYREAEGRLPKQLLH